MIGWGGIDPLVDKRAKRAALKKARTFGDYCDEFLESALAGFSNEKHRYQWRATLTNDAAVLRPLLLQAITTENVKKVLEPIWHTEARNCPAASATYRACPRRGQGRRA